MAEAIFQFSPGGCAKTCVCTRCNDAEGVTNATPRRVVVTILGVDYSLWHWNASNQAQNCVWRKVFSTPVTIGTCGTNTEIILLTISEAAGVKSWLLQVYDTSSAIIYQWTEAMDSQGACFTSQTLDTNLGTCTADNPITAALSMPDGPRPPCCPCESAGSGSAGECACCAVTPSSFTLTIPDAVWADSRCTACDAVVGEFDLSHINSCVWRYLNENWCTPEGQPATLEITLQASGGGFVPNVCTFALEIAIAHPPGSGDGCTLFYYKFLVATGHDCMAETVLTRSGAASSGCGLGDPATKLCIVGPSQPATLAIIGNP